MSYFFYSYLKQLQLLNIIGINSPNPFTVLTPALQKICLTISKVGAGAASK
jgi:hypothetical protein